MHDLTYCAYCTDYTDLPASAIINGEDGEYLYTDPPTTDLFLHIARCGADILDILLECVNLLSECQYIISAPSRSINGPFVLSRLV